LRQLKWASYDQQDFNDECDFFFDDFFDNYVDSSLDASLAGHVRRMMYSYYSARTVRRAGQRTLKANTNGVALDQCDHRQVAMMSFQKQRTKAVPKKNKKSKGAKISKHFDVLAHCF